LTLDIICTTPTIRVKNVNPQLYLKQNGTFGSTTVVDRDTNTGECKDSVNHGLINI